MGCLNEGTRVAILLGMTRRHPVVFGALAALGILLVNTSPCRADTPGQDKALAEALFDQAVTLLKQGSNAEACPKLVESQRLDPAPGTLLYLGDCYEKVGKLASAWATFREAAASAHAANQSQREELARKRAALVEQDLPYLFVSGAEKSGAVEVRLDDSPLRKALWEGDVPVDPGEHVIVAQAPGYETWKTTLVVAKGQHTKVVVPALIKQAGPPVFAPLVESPKPATAQPPPPMDTRAERPWQKPTALVLGGVGLVAVGLGSFFGVRAFSQWSDAESQCPNDRCTGTGRQSGSDASTSATVSTVSFVAGAVLLAGGATLYFSAPKARNASLKVGIAGSSAVVEGRF